MGTGVAPLYEGWERINAHLANRLPTLRRAELDLRAGDAGYPVWALIAHLAGARVYWLCGVLGEPGAETTAFPDPFGEGWEDQPARRRGSADLLFAVESSWGIVEGCLARWTPVSLGETVSRVRDGTAQRHSRASILARLVMHDAFHCGEISLLLGARGLPALDPWTTLP